MSGWNRARAHNYSFNVSGRARTERAWARGRAWFSEPDPSSTVRMRIQYFDATARAVIGPLTKSFPESLFFTSKARGSVNQSTDRRTDRPPPPPQKKNSSDLHEPHRSPKCMIKKRLAPKSVPFACLLYELGCDLLTTTNRPYVRMYYINYE